MAFSLDAFGKEHGTTDHTHPEGSTYNSSAAVGQTTPHQYSIDYLPIIVGLLIVLILVCSIILLRLKQLGRHLKRG